MAREVWRIIKDFPRLRKESSNPDLKKKVARGSLVLFCEIGDLQGAWSTRVVKYCEEKVFKAKSGHFEI